MSATTYLVRWAIYGAASSNNQVSMIDVTSTLQTALATSSLVGINNTTFTDPDVGYTKGFGAIVSVNGTDQFFAAAEGQSIDFSQAPGSRRKK